MHTKKIIYLNQAMGMGGAEVFMTDLLEALQDRKWQVSAVTTRLNFASYLKQHNLETKRAPFIMDVIGDWKGLLKAFFFGPLAFLQWVYILLQHLTGAKNTTVLLSGFNEKLLVTGIAKTLGYNVVWIQFSGLGLLLDKWGGWVGSWFKWSIQQADQVITSSEHSKKAIISELPITAQQVPVIPCGRKLEVKNYKAVQNKKIVCISRLQPGKGQDVLIQAMPTVLKNHPDATLEIIGEGDFEIKLRKLVSELNLEKHVIFKGRVDSIEKELQTSMISVFPSVWDLEGFGLVLIEAMAAAKPIVTFDRGPMNEIIQHKRNGLLAEAGSVKDLAEKIISLLDDEKIRKKLAVQAAQDFEARYTIKEIARQYETTIY
jgi:glycosyltransferase involved in cell wall biosynthesis